MELKVNAVAITNHQVRGPFGYTPVGLPTITNGLVTLPSSGSYLTTETTPLNVSFNTSTDELEIVETFITGSSITTSNGYLLLRSENGSTSISLNSGAAKVFRLNFSTYTLLGTTILQPNTTYQVKVLVQNNNVSLYLSVNGADYVLESSSSVEPAASALEYIRLGRNSSSVWLQNNTIDLNKTYVKLNGKLLFYQPGPTQKIYVNNVLVWEKTQ